MFKGGAATSTAAARKEAAAEDVGETLKVVPPPHCAQRGAECSRLSLRRSKPTQAPTSALPAALPAPSRLRLGACASGVPWQLEHRKKGQGAKRQSRRGEARAEEWWRGDAGVKFVVRAGVVGLARVKRLKTNRHGPAKRGLGFPTGQFPMSVAWGGDADLCGGESCSDGESECGA